MFTIYTKEPDKDSVYRLNPPQSSTEVPGRIVSDWCLMNFVKLSASKRVTNSINSSWKASPVSEKLHVCIDSNE